MYRSGIDATGDNGIPEFCKCADERRRRRASAVRSISVPLMPSTISGSYCGRRMAQNGRPTDNVSKR